MSDNSEKLSNAAETPSEDDFSSQDNVNFETLSLLELLKIWISNPLETTKQVFSVALDEDNQQRETSDSITSSSVRNTTISKRDRPEWVDRVDLSKWISTTHLVRVIWLGFIILTMTFASSSLREASLDPIRKAEGDVGSFYTWAFVSVLIYVGGLIWFSRERIAKLYEKYAGASQETLSNSNVFIDSSDEDNLSSAGDISALDSFNSYRVKKGTRPLVPPNTETRLKNNDSIFIDRILDWFALHWMRFMLAPFIIIFSWYAFDKNAILNEQGQVVDVVFTDIGFRSWIIAIILAYIAFTVDLNGVYKAVTNGAINLEAMRQKFSNAFTWHWTYLFLLVIIIFGASFRLQDIEAVPSVMTSDHLEKLRDSIRINEGYSPIFLPNNGGREPFQMYFIDFLADDLGLGFSFTTLKYASVIEGIIAIALMFVLAKVIFGNETEENERLGSWVGLASAGLLAISSWHVIISRLGLRIPLTPIATILTLIFLVRAIRNNRRIDFVNLGVVLGAGMYWYQSDRMLPIIAIVMVAIIMLARLPRMNDIWKYGVNFAMAGIIAIIIFLPMYRYSLEFPGEYWSRAYGRIFGDYVYGYCDPDPETGVFEYCGPSTSDIVNQIVDNRDIIFENYEKMFKMYGWSGDPAWFHNGNKYPALDATTNALFMVGALFWVAYSIRRRDWALLIVPIGLIIMMLPSTIAISDAAINENPGFTRSSGTIPIVFLLAGYPIGLLVHEIIKTGHTRLGFYVIALLVGGWIINSAYSQNYDNYFDNYQTVYNQSWKPYDQIAEPLEDFVASNGDFGNAYYIHYPHWLDHRILGAMAGDVKWPNSVDSTGVANCLSVVDCMRANEGTDYEYDPDKPILLFINTRDQRSLNYYQDVFPNGELSLIEARYNNDFYVYEAPAGYDWVGTFSSAQTKRFACMKLCGLLR